MVEHAPRQGEQERVLSCNLPIGMDEEGGEMVLRRCWRCPHTHLSAYTP
jgi:hypothetical protein